MRRLSWTTAMLGSGKSEEAQGHHWSGIDERQLSGLCLDWSTGRDWGAKLTKIDRVLWCRRINFESRKRHRTNALDGF